LLSAIELWLDSLLKNSDSYRGIATNRYWFEAVTASRENFSRRWSFEGARLSSRAESRAEVMAGTAGSRALSNPNAIREFSEPVMATKSRMGSFSAKW
jgi:hypothetical protein